MIIMVEFVLIKLKDYEEIYPGVIVEGLLSRVILFVGLPFQISKQDRNLNSMRKFTVFSN